MKLQPLLPDPEYYERWLEKNGISMRQIETETPCLVVKKSDGSTERVALTLRDVERLIAREDPVAWAFLNLQESKGVRSFEHPTEWYIQPGEPWDLFEMQKKLARIIGMDLVIECGSEVGKTRDIVLGSLWEADIALGGDGSLIAADSDTTLEEIWEELVFQTETNPLIGGGVKKVKIKPFRTIYFNRGFSLQLRICGHDGQQFRGAHISKTVRADEVAKWKNPQQLNELYRSLKPGAYVRLYSTPDGDYSSPFYAICRAATALDGRKTFETIDNPLAPVATRPFKKVNITKMDLPYPFWSLQRAETYRTQYMGEHSLGWITNVLGAWGSPQASVFPWELLKPLLKYLPGYRMARVSINEEALTYDLAYARLDPAQEKADRDPELGGALEDVLIRDRFSMDGATPSERATSVARHISRLFPDTTDMKDPLLFAGCDVGKSDQTEIVVVRQIGLIWRDIFRLNLSYAPWPMQTEIIRWLDHASSHRMKWSVDNGSAGAYMVSALCEEETKAECPDPNCGEYVEWMERLSGRGFGEAVDEIDIYTGERVLNPDRKDESGNHLPFRWSNKEFSTRIMEKKAHNREWEMAHDGGAGDQKLSGPQLLTNHTVIGVSKKSERQFKDKDSHHPDARRQAALAIVDEVRNAPRTELNEKTFRTTGMRPAVATFEREIGIATGRVANALGSFGGVSRGGVRGGMW